MALTKTEQEAKNAAQVATWVKKRLEETVGSDLNDPKRFPLGFASRMARGIERVMKTVFSVAHEYDPGPNKTSVTTNVKREDERAL